MTVDNTVITRKRKKYKFARFAEFNNCFEAAEFAAQKLQNHDLIVELGAGNGLFLCQQAKLKPSQQFVAVDVKADRLYTGAKAAAEQGINNIIFVRAHAEQLQEMFGESSVKELWLTFSDPFPKKRHAKHRLTHRKFLQLYCKILQPQAVLHFKTDNHALFDWSLEQFVAEGWALANLSFDLHASSLPEHYKIMTAYEQRFAGEGLPIYSVDVAWSAS